ncbi:hypothetical protein HORM4_90073 [Vibrio harveyi]|nr:hypothetical protein VHARVF571_90085 [Vibrio harveyi]CAK6717001.1 hypothetical protein HORM4_90073 [Vibrio harveyi]
MFLVNTNDLYRLWILSGRLALKMDVYLENNSDLCFLRNGRYVNSLALDGIRI